MSGGILPQCVECVVHGLEFFVFKRRLSVRLAVFVVLGGDEDVVAGDRGDGIGAGGALHGDITDAER